MTKIFFFLLFFSFSLFTLSQKQYSHNQPEQYSSLEKSLINQGYTIISDGNDYIIDLRYATNNNFTNHILYDSLHTAFLHPMAAEMLEKAHKILKSEYHDYRFIIFDAARPLSVQKAMYDAVKNTPYHKYVASPENTGLHNYGMAVDLSLYDTKTKKELDMGTQFDYFGSLAGINQEEALIATGKLTRQQVKNRNILRQAMTKAGFQPIRGEWWHFNAVSRQTAREKYKVIE